MTIKSSLKCVCVCVFVDSQCKRSGWRERWAVVQMVIRLLGVLILLSYAGCNCMLCAASVPSLMNGRETRCGREYECLFSGSHTHSTHPPLFCTHTLTHLHGISVQTLQKSTQQIIVYSGKKKFFSTLGPTIIYIYIFVQR